MAGVYRYRLQKLMNWKRPHSSQTTLECATHPSQRREECCTRRIILPMRIRCTYFMLLGFFLCFGFSCLAQQQQTQAILLDSEQGSLCGYDCPLIPLPNIYGDYLFCFQTGDKLLIGEHQAWEIGLKKLASLKGKALLIRYDDDHVWVKLPSGWQVRLSQYDFEYPFKNESCRDAAQMRSFEHAYTRPQPVPGPAIPVMSGKLVSGWAICSPQFGDSFSNCTVWDLKGNIRQKRLFQQMPETHSSSKTQVGSESPEGNFQIIHLKDGRTLQAYEVPLKAR